jgi:hypothetical protein
MVQFVYILPPAAGAATIAVLLIRQFWLWLNGTLAREAEELRREQAGAKLAVRSKVLDKIEDDLGSDIRWQKALQFYDRHGDKRL